MAACSKISDPASIQTSGLDHTQWTRPKLTHEDLRCLAIQMRTEYGWKAEPRPFQLAGVQAQLEGVDMIIQASTGSGKTAVAAGPHLWRRGMISVMVCPLMTLEDEMV